MNFLAYLLTPKALIALALVAILAVTNYTSYRVGRALVAGAWAQERETQAKAALVASEAATAEQIRLQERVEDVDRKLQAEKARRADAVRMAADSVRKLDELYVAAQAESARDPQPPGGTDDPRAAIARECTAALGQMGEAYEVVATKARPLQDYASSVCVNK